MTLADGHEGLRDAGADSVTFAFGDASAELYGLARLGLSRTAAGAWQGSALALLFAGRAPVTALAEGGLAVPGGAGWDALELAGLGTTIEAPLDRWTVRLETPGGEGFALEFTATGTPVALDADTPAGRLGGMAGYDQPCRVRGTVRADGRERSIAALGQRGHAWGEPDWERIELARTVCAWTDAGSASLTAIRPAGARHHDEEATWAAMWEPEAGAGPGRRPTQSVLEIEEGRLSTTYDAEGHMRRAGMELWPAGETGDAWARRAAGEVLVGSSLDLGALRLDCAFFRWHLEGRPGVGRYDIVRRAA